MSSASSSSTPSAITSYREKFNETVKCVGIIVKNPTIMSSVVSHLQKTDKVFVKKGFTSILDCSATLNHVNATINPCLPALNENNNNELPKGSRVIVMDPTKVPIDRLLSSSNEENNSTITVDSFFSSSSSSTADGDNDDIRRALDSIVSTMNSKNSNTNDDSSSKHNIDSLFALAQVDVHISYLNFTSTEILSKLLPPGVVVPSGFEQVGHIVHLNLSASHQPYKQLIAQVILDCAPKNTIRTVINKTESISSEFRELPFELLAGDADYTATLKQHGITFSVPYDKVYWNSRLSHEHIRLVTEAMQSGDQLLDVMAGVGPFALPAVSNQLPVRLKSVYANDLNPASVEAMRKNIELNKIRVMNNNNNNNSANGGGGGITFETFVMDGRKFIREIGRDQQLRKGKLMFHHSSPKHKPASAMVKNNSNNQQQQQNSTSHIFRRHALRHFVMNLPATAVLFLDAFTNTTDNGNDTNWPEPLRIDTEDDVHRKFLDGCSTFDHTFVVHVYCFSSFSDQQQAMNDAVDQVAKVLKRPCGKQQQQEQEQEQEQQHSVVVHKVHIVRDVAPNKLMVCVSFSPSIMAPSHLHDAIRKEINCFDSGKKSGGDRRGRGE